MRAERDGDIDDRWALHASDRALLGNKTGATRLGFAVLLKMFQANGRFPYRLEEVPVAVVEAIASQIEVPAEAWRGYDWRSRAAAYHRAQIRDALGFREPTLDDTDALTRWLEGQVSALEHRPDRLLMAARERCRSLRIEPPSPDRIDRLVRSVVHRHEEAWCDGLLVRLPAATQTGLDALLKAPDSDVTGGKDNRAPLLALRAGAGHASLQSVGEEADFSDAPRPHFVAGSAGSVAASGTARPCLRPLPRRESVAALLRAPAAACDNAVSRRSRGPLIARPLSTAFQCWSAAPRRCVRSGPAAD